MKVTCFIDFKFNNKEMLKPYFKEVINYEITNNRKKKKNGKFSQKIFSLVKKE